MAEEIEQDINKEDLEYVLNHPAMVEFRNALFQDRFDKSKAAKKQVKSYEQAKEFGFLSHVYYNQIENGKKAPALSTLLKMVDKMGLEITFHKKPEEVKSN